MKRAKSILALLMAIPLAGCVLRGKPAVQPPASPLKPVANAPVAPPPEPPPLSVPQTQAQLPAPQPIPEEALATVEAPGEEPPARPAPPVKTPSKRLPSRSGPTPVETSSTPALPASPTPEERQPIQEILPADQQTRLLADAKTSRQEAQQMIARVQARRPNRQQRDAINRIQGLLKGSENSEQKGDVREAKVLADRALVMAKELR